MRRTIRICCLALTLVAAPRVSRAGPQSGCPEPERSRIGKWIHDLREIIQASRPTPMSERSPWSDSEDITHPPAAVLASGRDVTAVALALDSDPAFAALREKDAVAALRFLFDSPDLPGDDASERLEFVLAYMADAQRAGVPFRVGLKDSGLRPELSDGALWPVSNQVSHFMMAVQLGRERNAIVRTMLYQPAVIGHEMVGDEYGGLWQTAWGMVAAPNFGSFHRAVRAASRGDLATVSTMSRRFVDVPETPGEWNRSWERKGNSQQDMRLTAYGWALGSEIRTGNVRTRAEVSSWIGTHIAAVK